MVKKVDNRGANTSRGQIRVGMGGWSYDPWRETFYPPEIKAKQELEYASRQVTAIEINSTFYRLQTPAVFAKWRDATPKDFLFCVKAPRFITQRKVLAEGIAGVERFIGSGIGELDNKLGAILWQLAPMHHFASPDLDEFLAALPKKLGKRRLRHALNVRHESFQTSEFITLARKHDIAVVYEDDADYPAIADVTGDFVYARLRRSVASQLTGYSKPALAAWTKRTLTWATGREPEDLSLLTKSSTSPQARDVFIFFINGAKERAPAAARQLLANLEAALTKD